MFNIKIPKNFTVGLIPDGQRRYCRKMNYRKENGDYNYKKAYNEGYKTIKNDFLEACLDYEVKNSIIYGFSADNFKRKIAKEILKFEEEKIRRLLNDEEIYNNKMNVEIITSMEEELPSSLIEVANKVYKNTKQFTKRNIKILIGYSMNKQISKVLMKNPKVKSVAEKVGNILGLGKDIDEIHLIIRSGSVRRLSGFPHTDYSTVKFVDKLFPEMNREDFSQIFEWYLNEGKKSQNYGE